jgi:flagellar hook-associated protein 1
MSISAALSNALSGLTVSARAADVISSNVANAMTEGYGARSIDIGTRLTGQIGAGAQVLGVLRQEDPVLTAQRRGAEAELGVASGRAEFLGRVETLIGTPDMPGSLAAGLAEFEARLVAAANAPQSDVTLGAAVEGAMVLTERFREISDGIQEERLRADSAIGQAVTTINDALTGIAELNERIRAVSDRSGDYASLVDAQTRLVDRIAPLVALQTRRDASGALQVFSEGGAMLVDRRAATLGFQATPAIEPGMLFGASILSAVSIDGRPVGFGGSAPALGGGGLAALVALRDDWGPAAQARIDAVARDLAERFDAPGPDATRAPGAAGLFTDAGALSDPANETGLAGRIAVNAAVRPEAGGQSWRLRDGLGAAAEGPKGNATLLLDSLAALSEARVTASGGFSASGRSMAALVAEHVSLVGVERRGAESREATASSVYSALRQQERARGVDTDAEMQNLLRIEKMYAANARVVNAAEAMLDELMRIAR